MYHRVLLSESYAEYVYGSNRDRPEIKSRRHCFHPELFRLSRCVCRAGGARCVACDGDIVYCGLSDGYVRCYDQVCMNAELESK